MSQVFGHFNNHFNSRFNNHFNSHFNSCYFSWTQPLASNSELKAIRNNDSVVVALHKWRL